MKERRIAQMKNERTEVSYSRLCDEIASQLDYLEKVFIPVAYLDERKDALILRKKSLEQNMPKIEQDLNYVKEDIISRRKLAEYKEKI